MRMNILIGCEFSDTVAAAFRKRGHAAFSCDLLPTEGDIRFHLKMDVFEAINCHLKWDVIILHPPCTKIALCGNSTYGKGMPKHAERLEAIQWTGDLWATARCKARIGAAMENPKNVMGKFIGKHTQAIQPWQFGHPEQKETWLWLDRLPPLKPAQNVHEAMMKLPRKERERLHFMSPSPTRGQDRSRTFSGIAKAMSEQWSNIIFSDALLSALKQAAL